MSDTITVKYSCHTCGINKAEVDVPVRQPDGDLVRWIDAVAELIAVDHLRRTPGCMAESIQDVMIPLDNRNEIGGPVIN